MGGSKDEVGACAHAEEAAGTCREEHLLPEGGVLAVPEEVVGRHTLPLQVSVGTADELADVARMVEEVDDEMKWPGCKDHLATGPAVGAVELVVYP